MGKVLQANVLAQTVMLVLDDVPGRVEVPASEIGMAVRVEEEPNRALVDSGAVAEAVEAVAPSAPREAAGSEGERDVGGEGGRYATASPPPPSASIRGKIGAPARADLPMGHRKSHSVAMRRAGSHRRGIRNLVRRVPARQARTGRRRSPSREANPAVNRLREPRVAAVDVAVVVGAVEVVAGVRVASAPPSGAGAVRAGLAEPGFRSRD